MLGGCWGWEVAGCGVVSATARVAGWGGGDNVGKELIDLGTLEGLGEKEWPVWLYIISRLLDDRSQFGGRNFKSIVVEHESSVRAAEFAAFV